MVKILIFVMFLPIFVRAEGGSSDTSGNRLRAKKLLDSGYQYLMSGSYDSALTVFSSAKDQSQKLGSWTQVAYSLNALAECYQRKEKNERADEMLSEALMVEAKHGPPGSSEEARTQELLGGLLIQKEEYHPAIQALERSVQIRTQLIPVDSVGLVASYATLGAAWRNLGDFHHAMQSMRAAFDIVSRRPAEHPLELAQVLLLMGTTESSRGEHDSAIVLLSKSLSVLEAAGKSASPLTGDIYIWLAACYANKGSYAEAASLQKKALAASTTSFGGTVSVGNCYTVMGEQYLNLGNYEKAVELLTQGLQLMKASLKESHSGLAAPLNLLARAYCELKQLDTALACVNQSITIRKKALGDQHPSLCYSYENKGDILRRKGRPRGAIGCYRKALEICQRMNGNPDRYDIVRLLIVLGSTERELGRLNQADSLLRLALDRGTHSTTRSPVQMAAAHKALGDLAYKEGKYSEALQEYQQSVINLCDDFSDMSLAANPLPEQVRNRREIVPVLAAKGKALRQLYRRKASDERSLVSALKSYEAALEIGDAAQRDFTSTEAKLFHEEENSSLHEAAVDIAVELLHRTGDSFYREHAFALAEQSRAQVLLENINESHVEHFGGIPDSTLRKESALRAEVNSCDILIDRGLAGMDSLSPGRLSRLQGQRFAARAALDELGEQLRSEYPGYYDILSGRPALPLDSLQNMLGPGTALIEYFAGKSDLYVFVLKAGSLQLVTVPGAKIPDDDVRRFLGALKSIDQPLCLRYGAKLYRTVIAPIRPELHGITKLVLVPDGLLCYLPFEALLESAPNRQIRATTPPYLVKSFDITYSYSASFYSHCVERSRQTAAGSFAGFAPVFADTDRNSTFLASNMLAHQSDPSALRSITVDGKHFNELKFSEEEVQSISSSFRQSGLSVLQFLHGGATEEAFKQRAGTSKFVHVATHGLMNGANPRLSGLLFSPPADTAGRDDGILYAGEMYDMKLDADLLVLSSCESGVGKLIRGEGVMAITRGLFYAGARNIVVSLWRIYDKQTAQFMRGFYKGILHGMSYSRALREAKLRMIENPSTAFPSKWAGFVLIGL